MVTYANKPPVEGISGLSPSISVNQGLSNRSPRSTVGTATEVFTYLRVLFARIGHRPCPQCGRDVPPAHEGGAEGVWDESDEVPALGDEIPSLQGAPPGMEEDAVPEMTDGGWVACPHCGTRRPEMNMAMFSFNKPAGACPTCTGLGTIYAPDLGAPAGRRQEHPRRRGGGLGCASKQLPRHDAASRRAPLRLRFRPGAADPRPGPGPT